MTWNVARLTTKHQPKNIPPKSHPIRNPPKAYRLPIVNGRRKWIDEALEEAMDAIEGGNTTLKKANRLWNIPLNSLSNHLNGKTQTMKVGVRILTIKEDVTIITWILAMQKESLSINIQQK